MPAFSLDSFTSVGYKTPLPTPHSTDIAKLGDSTKFDRSLRGTEGNYRRENKKVKAK
jgi:hypothetical protein